MKEKLIRDYMIATDGDPYLPEGSIQDIFTAGEWVMFTVSSSCGHYFSNHQIVMLDIVAWVYSEKADG